MSSWTTFALWVIVPFLFTKGRQYFAKPSNPRPPRPRSKTDFFCTVFLVLTAILHLLLAFLPATNLLREMSVAPDPPSWVLRNGFRNLMVQRFPSWREGSDLEADTEETRIEKLYEALKVSENRKMYLRFGHDAYVQCSWCSQGEQRDYLFASLPPLASSYALFLALIGCGTLTWRKATWRTHAPLSALVVLIVEMYVLTLHDSQFVDARNISECLADKIRRYRLVAFALVAIGAAILDKKDEWSEEDIMRDLIQKNQIIYNRTQAYRLARAATLGDQAMRKKFLEHYREREVVHDLINRDNEYKETRDKVLLKYNLEKLMQDAQTQSSIIVQAAIDEGIIDNASLAQFIQDAHAQAAAAAVVTDTPTTHSHAQTEPATNSAAAVEPVPPAAPAVLKSKLSSAGKRRGK
ncbi:hypothetical protein HKX48_004983 [Thoreauomyces humboldtii]|nr:hypothetical protein HKX48_004983 [Thoreauomyces humboldtii]